MIKLVRIDHRLVHGQVAFRWVKFIECDCILLASDSLMKDEIKMSVMKLAKPAGVKLVMKDVESSIQALNSGVTDKYKLFVVVEDVESAYRLAKACPTIKSINVGGLKGSENSKQISKAVSVDEKDVAMLKELHTMGVELEARQVPDEEKLDVIKLIEKEF